VGLEAVEIVMRVEEVFDLTIEDSEAEKCATPGQLIDLVLGKVGRTSEAACLTQRAFHRVRASLMRLFGLRRNQIRPDVPLANLFPRPTRKARVRQLLAGIGLGKDIEFVRPEWLSRVIGIATLSGGIAVAVYLAWHPISSKSQFLSFICVSPIVAGVLFSIIFGWLACLATRRMLIEFQPSMSAIGQLSRWIVANAPDLVKAPSGQWSREQVSEIIREIVIDKLGCGKEYREDAHFVKDLGLS
jgi:hypothetical protein